MPLRFLIMSKGSCGVIDPVFSHLLPYSSLFYFQIANSLSLSLSSALSLLGNRYITAMADSNDGDLQLHQSTVGATGLQLLRAPIGASPPSDQDGVDLLHASRAGFARSIKISGQ